MKKILVPALLVLALGAATPAWSASPGKTGMQRHGVMMGGPKIERLFRNLDLQPEQRGQLETIRARHQKAAEPIRTELRKKREELFALMKTSSATQEQSLAKQHEVQALEGRLAEMRLNSWFEARKVLSPDQMKKLDSIRPGKANKGRRGK